MKAAVLCLALICLAAPAVAADKTTEIPRYVNLSPVALPVVVNGQVINYVFVAVRIDLTTAVDPSAVGLKEPYFRDALVREAHRTPFTLASDYTKIDQVKLCAALLADARAIAGANAIVDVRVLTQTPKSTRVPLPRQGNSTSP